MLEKALGQCPVSICITDPAGVIQYVNSAFAEACGYRREELPGRMAGVLKSGTTAPEVYKELWVTISSGRRWHGQFCNRRRNGELFWERESISPVFDSRGTIIHYVAVKEDITRLRELEEQTRHSQRMEAVGALASGIAHELNNILAPMVMAPELLREAVKDPSERELLDLIERSARRAADVVKQLLVFSRRSGGERVPVQPAAVVRELHGMLAGKLPPEVLLELEVDEDVGAVVGDPSQLLQALLNLCANSLDAMPDGGRLGVRAHNANVDEEIARANPPAKPGPHVVLAISDTGQGMTPAIKDRIFDPFFTTKGVGKGTGLGLPTVLGIVRSHGGFVTVETAPSRGSTFRLHLPGASG